MAGTTIEITLKLLIDRNTQKVLFAEAKKDFVDLLFGLLLVPVGSIMKSLGENELDGASSMDRVVESVSNLESSYFLPNVRKNLLLWPEMSSSSSSINIPPLLQSFVPSKTNCNSATRPVSNSPFAGSPSPFGCATVPSSSKEEEGFVSGTTQYMVMDDLTVKPLSPISTITLFNAIGVRDFSSLEEKNVTINFKKGLELVKASFVSRTVLSDVFVRNQQARHEEKTLKHANSE